MQATEEFEDVEKLYYWEKSISLIFFFQSELNVSLMKLAMERQGPGPPQYDDYGVVRSHFAQWNIDLT